MEPTVTICESPYATFDLGEKIARELRGGEAILLFGGLGAGKTLLTKGILHGLDYDIDEVTSPSFALVNLYKTTRFDVYHIDLWRLDRAEDVAMAVGLDEIYENERAIVIIEWAERLGKFRFSRGVIRVSIEGGGDEIRRMLVENALTSAA